MVGSSQIIPVFIALLAVLGSGGCRPKKAPPAPAIDFNQKLPPGQMALRKISPGEYPDFSRNMADPESLIKAIDASLTYMAAPSSQQYYPYLDITHERAVATLRGLRDIVDRQLKNPTMDGAALNQEIIRRFDVYKSYGAPRPDNTGYTDTVLFTGYFTPIYDASRTRTGPYQFPLYKRPADLVSDPANPERASRKTPDGRYVPYYTRREIEGPNQPLAGQELVWLKSRWETYVISIQGSAKLRLTDGSELEIGYAGLNGYPYTSPGMQMVADGVLKESELSNKRLRAYFEANPAAMDKYLWLNDRYVFFTERPGGPFGALNVPVTPFATIATDKSVYPRAMPAFLQVPMPINETGQTTAFSGFMLDQDRGGAIRAAGRCDIYMGIGPAAERVAGHQLHQGSLYYIAIKPEFIKDYAEVALRN